MLSVATSVKRERESILLYFGIHPGLPQDFVRRSPEIIYFLMFKPDSDCMHARLLFCALKLVVTAVFHPIVVKLLFNVIWQCGLTYALYDCWL